MDVRLFLARDVTTCRGIDQNLAHPCDPTIHEPYLKNALDYVRIAEKANGSIPRHVERAASGAMHSASWSARRLPRASPLSKPLSRSATTGPQKASTTA